MTEVHRVRALLIGQFHNPTREPHQLEPVPARGDRACGEPAPIWTCPDCHHTWVSAVGPFNKAWRCSCGHDTRKEAERRKNQRRKKDA